MWADLDANGAEFSAGDDVDEAHGVDSFGFWNPEAVARGLGFGDGDVESQILAEDEEEDFLAEIMRNAGECRVETRSGGDGLPIFDPQLSEWFPYPSKMMFLLDTLDNLPRLRISGSLMRVFLWVVKEAHCKDVPFFGHLRRVQKSIRAECGIPTIPCKSVQGSDWANPTTRKLIHVYPEVPKDGIIKEIWHAQKWRQNMDLDCLSPMWDFGSSHYYVNEICRLGNGKFVIPIRWVMCDGKIHADVFSVSFNDQGEATIKDTETLLVCSDQFVDNYLDLEHAGKIPEWPAISIESGHAARMPNPKRIIAGGDPLCCSMVDYFGDDDVSGNRTKSWNTEFHVHFISTSPNASITEQYTEFKKRVELTHEEPVKVQDETRATTRFCLYANSGPSDNLMQSEISSHIGGKDNYLCRKCNIGGRQKDKATDEGYHAFTGVKDMYTQLYWINELITRFKEMKKDDPTRSTADIQEELIQWTVENSDKIYSGFLATKGFDPTRDTPVEILHTILLGIVKYIWHISHTPWSEATKNTYTLRLQSTATDGLSIHAIRTNYIMQYAGSLVGRQLKTIVQTNIFHIHGLVTEHQFMGWKATGKLSALLWCPEIRNPQEYRQDLKVAVANVLDAFTMIDPSKIITKVKYHLLVHLEDDMVEFGPLIGVMTEVFECFNAISHFFSILFNHLAPSRDIAIQLGDQEGLKHRLTGGCRRTTDNEWQQAGRGVHHFMEKHPVLQKLVGWSEPKSLVHGAMKLAPLPRDQKERVRHKLGATSAALALNFGSYSAESTWMKCSHVISESLEQCLIRSWVFAQSSTDKNSVISGRISDILQSQDSVNLVVLELFQVRSTRDELYGMPILVRRDSETTFSIIPGKKFKFKFNVQHDCYSAKFEATGTRLRMQKRVESDQIENFIVHNPLDRYIINSHAFHNAHLLRETLPRDLIAPIPLFEDRRGKHGEMAAALRATQRKATAGKRKGRVDDDEDIAPPRKRPKTSTAPRSGRRQTTAVDTAETLAAGRAKRTITRTKKAAEIDVCSNEEEPRLTESSSDED
ncbi:hypothetical protein B0H17DRAFT_1160739 [Mycena rosella]|uniref:Uncharacterized protein n=1 Tax=Mycena rosella TaxID=1033263 RepID=A0AAD7GDH7_MYCRO|nr:hypothetical protein B0H17DRAFT_1160739 [Mycena rosella]